MSVELLNIDCMEYMKGLEDNAFDLAICDPEYGRREHGGTNRNHGVKQKNGSVSMCLDGGYEKKNWDNSPPDKSYFIELFRVSKNQIIWGSNYHPVALQGGAIIWDKVNDGSDQSGAEIAYCSLNNRVDIIRYMWRGMMQGESIRNGTKQQGNKSLNEKRIHPTQKPVKLYECLLDRYAKEGDMILDTHGGSFSLAIACYKLGFDFVGCELDKNYHDAACKRFDMETRQATLI